ncbi:MAG: Dyp-type peroxidase [Rhizobacter sp.]|nr:Dyp-type peroxidase [Rhizobacter sp.]
MHDDLKSEIATRHLQNFSELTLQAPIRQGFVESLDSRTYSTRLKMVMDTLHILRTTSREYSLIRPFSDSTDRIRTINSLRMWVDEPGRKLVLSVGFDRPWESYLRVIWRDVGTLLDVIFCNCTGYPISTESSFETYGEWIADARTDTRFFYNNGNLSVDDLQYLKQLERLHRDGTGKPGWPLGLDAIDLKAAALATEDAEQIASAVASAAVNTFDAVTQGMQALSVLYRLADVYPPGTRDGDVLLRAARQLLRELKTAPNVLAACASTQPAGIRFKSQLAWFNGPLRAAPPAPSDRVDNPPDDVQRGIVEAHAARLTHGCALLITVTDAVAAADFLARLGSWVTRATVAEPPDGVYVNVAFSHIGLKRLGLTEARLDAFPVEFREGMEARAGLLGDVRGNHPGRWSLPLRNWPAQISVNGLAARVQMSAVHIVVQMFIAAYSADGDHELVGNPGHPLHAKVTALMAGIGGVELLSVQALRRHLVGPEVPPGQLQPRDHFGFVDGISQPQVGPVPAGPPWNNFVPLGAVLRGHANADGDSGECDPLLHNGSFLVMRKLRQDVDALNERLAAGATATGLSADDLKSRMLGRVVATAAPLVLPAVAMANAFDYTADLDARLCPFQAHIRRANPRAAPAGQTVPRLMRRGMAYGPVATAGDGADRGVMFMAYNASIGEQFEVIQRWISGGNSSGVFSGEADPLLGVPQQGDPRTFRFHDGKTVMRMALDDPARPARPFVQLEWGAYLFAPSLSALQALRAIASAPKAAPALVIEGEQIIAALQNLELMRSRQGALDAWKELLEDSSARRSRRAQALWAAVRARHGGVLRTAYGVLVADRNHVMEVFQNAQGRYTVSGYHERMLESFGEIYLGLDAGAPYDEQSALANRLILSITDAEAFALARDLANKELQRMIGTAKAIAAGAGRNAWELNFDLKEISDPVLANINKAWFDLPDEKHVLTGGWNWEDTPPRCPGHFTAPSRYIFQPNPGPAATRYGQEHGRVTRPAVAAFIADRRNGIGPPLAGRVSAPLFAYLPDTPEGNDLLGRTLIGIMMGYLPTVEANLRATLNEWLEDGRFWELQAALVSNPTPDPYRQANAVLGQALRRTMQLRPLPELTWRRVAVAHSLGGVAVTPADTIVIGMVSATQQNLGSPSPVDICPVFGGDRDLTGHPQHACPGRKAGMGVLLGVFAALMEAGPLRPTPAALTLRLRGSLP